MLLLSSRTLPEHTNTHFNSTWISERQRHCCGQPCSTLPAVNFWINIELFWIILERRKFDADELLVKTFPTYQRSLSPLSFLPGVLFFCQAVLENLTFKSLTFFLFFPCTHPPPHHGEEDDWVQQPCQLHICLWNRFCIRYYKKYPILHIYFPFPISASSWMK